MWVRVCWYLLRAHMLGPVVRVLQRRGSRHGTGPFRECAGDLLEHGAGDGQVSVGGACMVARSW